MIVQIICVGKLCVKICRAYLIYVCYIVSENKAVFASIECKCGMVQRRRKTELVADTLIDDVRAKVSRLCQQPSFVILLLNRKLYGRVIAMKEEFVNNNIYPFPCLEHVSR